jgi:hypothetical protein
MNEITDFDAWLAKDFAPVAVYMDDADCVEYVREDTTSVYRRVDQLLTLIYDETNEIPIGFKLKGFKRILLDIRDRLSLCDDGFASLVGVLELVCTEIGDELIQDPKRRSAYAAASKLAKDVRIDLDLAA